MDLWIYFEKVCLVVCSQWSYIEWQNLNLLSQTLCNMSATSKASKGKRWNFELCDTSTTNKTSKAKWLTFELLAAICYFDILSMIIVCSSDWVLMYFVLDYSEYLISSGRQICSCCIANGSSQLNSNFCKTSKVSFFLKLL